MAKKRLDEAAWLAATDPRPLLTFLGRRVTERKLRLFAVACCRRVWRLLADSRSRESVELAERAADEPISYAALDEASSAASEAVEESLMIDPTNIEDEGAHNAIGSAASAAEYASNPDLHDCGVDEVIEGASEASPAGTKAELAAQAALVRDLFGNPFRLIPADPFWESANADAVRRIAETIYQERRFEELPVLADALEEAGCNDAAILDHCRRPGEHVRGCWVVDGLLHKG